LTGGIILRRRVRRRLPDVVDWFVPRALTDIAREKANAGARFSCGVDVLAFARRHTLLRQPAARNLAPCLVLYWPEFMSREAQR